jgi:ABC-2 type transport system permease protein
VSVAWAFVKRDFCTAASYRTSFVMQLAGILFQVALFYFVARLFGAAMNPSMQRYGNDYFAFLLIGVALSDYLGLSLNTFSASIREGQGNGTLELMLLSPTGLPTILVASSLWVYIFTSVRVMLYLVAGIVLFGVQLGPVDPLAAGMVLLSSVACFAGLGVISASFVIVLKRGDPLLWALGSLSTLLAGVFYPVEVLPEWLQAGSRLLPLTYSLEAMRLALMQGYSLPQIWPDVGILIGFSVVLLPLGFWSFRLAVRKAKADGSLTQF